ncbi:metallophosphoesterase [Alphaproteobacteria bacterium]|nr:metallophosphoesterase [Alphaproteobacteria bacterium]
MRILFLGDIVGSCGRQLVCDELPRLRARLELGAIVVNGENAAHGFGITEKIARELIAAGADAITTGNHLFNRSDASDMLRESGLPVVRPANFPPGAPGAGVVVVNLKNGRRLGVMQMLGRQFMAAMDCPFRAFDAQAPKLAQQVDALVVDFHAEATSEKVAMGHWLDGRASLVAGTHTHVPTADWRILPRGTAYITDAGMCGDYDGVIGMDKTEPLNTFLTGIRHGHLTPAEGPAGLAGVIVDTNDATGLARSVESFRFGVGLSPSVNKQNLSM